MAPTKRTLLTLQQAADVVGLTPRQVHRSAKAGKITYYKPGGPTGRLMFDPADLQAFLDSVRIEANGDE
jgi:excisionase family DNA binding protein